MNNTSPELLYGLSICHQVQDATVDIVFVHGLTGDRQSAWTHKPSGTFWPRDLLPNIVPQSRILTFGYGCVPSRSWPVAYKKCLYDHAKDLIQGLVRLRGDTRTFRRPIIFVAHGLGGLLVQDCLVQSRTGPDTQAKDIALSSTAIAFLSTPHAGSDGSKWTALLRGSDIAFKNLNPGIVDILRPNSELLARLQSEFQSMIRKWRNARDQEIKITCFYDELGYRGAGPVVPKSSAVLPAYEHYSIHANHDDMTKFGSEEDQGFRAVSGEIWGWVDDIARERM